MNFAHSYLVDLQLAPLLVSLSDCSAHCGIAVHTPAMATKTETSADDGIELKKPAVPKVCRNGSALQTPVFAIKCGALLEKVLVGWGWGSVVSEDCTGDSRKHFN